MDKTECAERKKELNRTLGISFCKLLEAHSLYDSRIDGRLPVLLIGKGLCLEFLRDKILSNGQLLNTKLEVTIFTDDPERDGKRLLEDAPELWRFLSLCTIAGVGAPEWELGSLTYQKGALTADGIAALDGDYRYVLVSLDDTAQNKALAECFPSGNGRVTAYVREEPGKEALVFPPKRRHTEQSSGQGAVYGSLIEPVAYNIHYAYARGNNPWATDEEIERDFQDEYNRESNLECALHIRSKLQCCGIDTDDPKQAAEQFQQMLSLDHSGELVNKLSNLEHRRWCITKLFQGLRRPTDLDWIYSEPDITTHNRQWHSALAPYGEPGAFRDGLMETDWIHADPDSIGDLDELDKQTLRIHKKCGEISRDLFELWEAIAPGIPEADERPEIRRAVDDLNPIMKELGSGNTRLYSSARELLKELSGLTEHLPRIKEPLNSIRCKLGAWYEFLTRKDYKEQCRIQVRSIPFFLSAWRNMTLVKLMSDDVDECVNSVWQLAPTRVIFVDYVDNERELASITLRAKRINRFLDMHGKDVEAEYRLYIGGEVKDISRDCLMSLDQRGCDVERVASAHADVLRPKFVHLLTTCHADYIDMTGGKPELIGLAQEFARNSKVGAFVIRYGMIRNYYGATGLNGLVLNKEMSVSQMFDRAGAKKDKQDDDDISTQMLALHGKFWAAAYQYRKDWNMFCNQFFAPACRKKEAEVGKKKWDGLHIEKTCFDEVLKEKPGVAPDICWRIMRRLQREGLVTLTTEEGTEVYTVSARDIASALKNSGKVLEYHIYATARGKFGKNRVAMSWQFWHDWEDEDSAQNEVDVICTRDTGSLFISAKFVSMDTIKSNGFINHVCYEVCEVADHFGLNAKKLLAAPNVPQYDKKTGELSRYVKHAMSRGVYLLGDVCFEKDRLGQVLENIAAGRQNWYEVEEKIPTGV